MIDNKVELEDVETALAAHPCVREAGAVLDDDMMSRRVIACIVGNDREPADFLDRLCCYVSQARPGAQIPDVFVLIDRMPVDAAGDLDRGGLLNATRGDGQDTKRPAIRGGLVAAVADIWREVLCVDSVSLADNLFDLGGESLAITRMTVRIREQLHVNVPLAIFYDTPTVPGIVSAIEGFRHSLHERDQNPST